MNTMRLLRLSTLGPLSGLVILSILAFFNQRSVNQAQANRYESLKLAYELRASSDELTRLARTYVVTGTYLMCAMVEKHGQMARRFPCES
jgi:hypothetical protein